MKKCDVCNKTSLLPESLGKANICKVCLLKINGPMWKYRKIESMNELEKHRSKAITCAEKNNFPNTVIEGINNYFDQRNSEMKKCDACGENMLTVIDMNSSKICRKCYSKIEIKELKNKKYISSNQLKEEKNKVINIAKNNNFPEDAIKCIDNMFENKIEKNWIYTIDGTRGQILKVYEEYFSINTTDEFDIDDVAEDYAKIYEEDHPKKAPYSKNDAKNIVKGVMGSSGGLVKDILISGVTKKGITSKSLSKMTNKFTNGIESAITNVVENAYDEAYPEKKAFRKHSGLKTYKYTDFEIVEFRDVGDDYLGYLKFQNKNTVANSDFDVLYFYGSDANKNIIKLMPEVYSYILNKINNSKKQIISEKENNNNKDNKNIVEDIKKFKELLDMGAITQEEYDKKKKELLEL